MIAIVLGVVEGLTEFLPISSTGHLIIVDRLFGRSGGKADAFEIFIQLGAVLAVVWEFRGTLMVTARGLRSDASARRFVTSLAVAFAPAAIVGFLIHGWIEQTLFSPRAVALALVVGGIAILFVEGRVRSGARFVYEDARAIPVQIALVIGLAQVLALFPGVSRSAATILCGLLVGLSRSAATEFSFYLAIPTLGAATVFSLLKVWKTLLPSDFLGFGVGLAVSFVVALVVIRFFLSWVRTHDLRPFAWYRMVLGVVVLLIFFR